MAARKRAGTKFVPWDERVKERIQVSMLVNRLTEHVNSPAPLLDSTQVTAALGLLKKALPDLAAVQHSGQLEVRRAEEITDDELAAIAAGSGSRVAEAPRDPKQLN